VEMKQQFVSLHILFTGGCKVANGIGIMVVISVFFALFAIFEHPKFVTAPSNIPSNINLLPVVLEA